ncbi:CoA transferase [Dietzia sp. UCD-THP]|uniref:CoA transferase n=1 Tax=Dietzia sp. UCD-THP TaxID=1292020 RepID=UPI00187BEDD6|nr:CoA transferase [Dietzia sp. UCD-THP]
MRLDSRLDVAELVTDSIGLASAAIEQVAAVRGRREPRPLRLRGDLITTSVTSERHFRLDDQLPRAWAPLSGFWPARDGWVRTHATYPHHEQRLRLMLGLDDAAGVETFAAAVAERSAVELEDEAAEKGAIVVVVRDHQRWARHPQAAAVAGTPLISRETVGAARARHWPGECALPLSGLRVLDMTRVIAGPVATRDLAYAGADVLRVDSPRLPEIAWQHLDTGQGKRSTTLDLASRVDRRVLTDLLATADVVVTGYRPGALHRFGLSPDQLAEDYPGLVIGSISAWGREGPWRSRRGSDSIVQAATGIAMVESPDGVRPGALPAQALDHSAGTSSLPRSPEVSLNRLPTARHCTSRWRCAGWRTSCSRPPLPGHVNPALRDRRRRRPPRP